MSFFGSQQDDSIHSVWSNEQAAQLKALLAQIPFEQAYPIWFLFTSLAHMQDLNGERLVAQEALAIYRRNTRLMQEASADGPAN